MAASPSQLIVSTQSVALLNWVSLDDVLVVEQRSGASSVDRLDAGTLARWLDDYSLGELWEKNLLGGGPSWQSSKPSPITCAVAASTSTSSRT